MTPSLYIVGAGGFGREVLTYARDVARATNGQAFRIAGFLDDNPDALRGHALEVGVVGALATARPGPDVRFVIALGDPRLRCAVARKLQELGADAASFCSIVHPTAYVAGSLRAGCVVAPFGFVGPGATLGAHAVLNTYASVGHDAAVGEYAVFSPYAVVNGNVVVETGAFLGTHATVVPGKRLGAWSKLGAGAVALADIEPGALALGNPAKGRVLFAPP
jgi:sugar O-acyltransferase (sialic acid O-acetyltransferase NeuD family)